MAISPIRSYVSDSQSQALKNIIILPAMGYLKYNGTFTTPTEEQSNLFLATCIFYQNAYSTINNRKFDQMKTLMKKCLCGMYEQVRSYKPISNEKTSFTSKIKTVFFETVLFVWIADIDNKNGDWELLGILFEDYSVENLNAWNVPSII